MVTPSFSGGIDVAPATTRRAGHAGRNRRTFSSRPGAAAAPRPAAPATGPRAGHAGRQQRGPQITQLGGVRGTYGPPAPPQRRPTVVQTYGEDGNVPAFAFTRPVFYRAGISRGRESLHRAFPNVVSPPRTFYRSTRQQDFVVASDLFAVTTAGLGGAGLVAGGVRGGQFLASQGVRQGARTAAARAPGATARYGRDVAIEAGADIGAEYALFGQIDPLQSVQSAAIEVPLERGFGRPRSLTQEVTHSALAGGGAESILARSPTSEGGIDVTEHELLRVATGTGTGAASPLVIRGTRGVFGRGTPSPAPSPSSTPSPTPSPSPAPGPLPSPSPAPSAQAPSAAPTPGPGSTTPTPTESTTTTPTPTESTSPTPTESTSPTPTESTSPTPTESASPTPGSASPTPSGSPTPTPGSPTPTASASPTPTPSRGGLGRLRPAPGSLSYVPGGRNPRIVRHTEREVQVDYDLDTGEVVSTATGAVTEPQVIAFDADPPPESSRLAGHRQTTVRRGGQITSRVRPQRFRQAKPAGFIPRQDIRAVRRLQRGRPY